MCLKASEKYYFKEKEKNNFSHTLLSFKYSAFESIHADISILNCFNVDVR
jgi:hypothetical protein